MTEKEIFCMRDIVPVLNQQVLFHIPIKPSPPKPPLKWAGGKRWLVSHIVPLWKPHRYRRLVEPFCGGLAVALGLSASHALLNDINPHLINFYHQLQQGLKVSLHMENNKTVYYTHRDRFNFLIREGKWQTPEAAMLFYYLNRTGYNGLCRFNKKGEFNVPFGQYKTIYYEDNFSIYANFFQGWIFQNKDFAEVEFYPGDFVYADPPYDVEFVHYSKEGFTWQDQVRLAEWLVNHPGPVVISNQATERIVQLYEKLGFSLQFLDAPRRISCNGDRKPAREVLATRGF